MSTGSSTSHTISSNGTNSSSSKWLILKNLLHIIFHSYHNAIPIKFFFSSYFHSIFSVHRVRYVFANSANAEKTNHIKIKLNNNCICTCIHDSCNFCPCLRSVYLCAHSLMGQIQLDKIRIIHIFLQPELAQHDFQCKYWVYFDVFLKVMHCYSFGCPCGKEISRFYLPAFQNVCHISHHIRYTIVEWKVSLVFKVLFYWTLNHKYFAKRPAIE